MPHLRHWLLATRPHTLLLTLTPVLCGAAWVLAQGRPLRAGVLALTLLAALVIQVAVNLLNDAGDAARGADGPERLGPPRATAQGWLPAQAVRRAGLGALALALLLGLPLAWVGGWPIVGLGLLSLYAAWAYTSGPRPLAWGAWGEVLVWLYFGVAAVAGTVWLQTGTLAPGAMLTGAQLGALAAAVLLVNNVRDAATDARAGRRTLALRLGLRASRALYAALLLAPFALQQHQMPGTPAPLLALPLAAWLIWRLAVAPPGRGHNRLLAGTAWLQALFAALLAAGWWLKL